MQVSTVCTNIYMIFGNTDTQTPNSANGLTQSSILQSASPNLEKGTRVQDFKQINEWKSFCCQNIETNNIDFIV